MSDYAIIQETQCQRVSDGNFLPILNNCESANRILVIILPQLGDFDSLEYAWWLKRESKKLQENGIAIRAVGIGDRVSGQKFCAYTQFPEDCLFIDSTAEIHTKLNLYR